MIRTLRITSVAAVILAAVVLASVLGFLRPASFLPLRVGTGSDKQTQSILSGPSAVERFKTQYGSKAPDTQDVPPLIKQAELLAGIINPPPALDEPPKPPGKLPIPPKLGLKPPVAVSSKFNLLATSYCSSNPKFSYAHIRLPDKDNTFQWVGVGEQIGHVTIKEIRKDSVVCWDGKNDSEVRIEAVPETSSLLETGKASNAVSSTTVEDSGTRPGPTGATAQPAAASSAKPGTLPSKPASGAAKPPSSAAKSLSSPAKPSTAAGQPTAPAAPAPSTQITKQEQEKLSRLGDRLKNSGSIDAAGQTETANRLINEFKSTQSLPPGVRELGDSAQTDPGPEPMNKTLRDEARRRFYSGRLTPPRAAKE